MIAATKFSFRNFWKKQKEIDLPLHDDRRFGEDTAQLDGHLSSVCDVSARLALL